MKFKDLVHYKIMQLMFRAKSKSLPDGAQKNVLIHESKYHLRHFCNFTVQKAKI